MTGFYLYSSNKQELLIQRLAEILRNVPLGNPLAPEVVMVQNHGMQRWASLELARINDIEANTRYIFPNELLQLAFFEVIPDYHGQGMLEKEPLVWAILELLPSILEDDGFAILRQYLAGGRQIKSYQLAKRIAGLLDQYCMFRPEMVLEWENSPGEDWQSHLWRALPQVLRDQQKPALRRRFFEHIKKALTRKHSLPERISIFGISFLPPFHLDVLCALSQYIEINLFLLNPTDQYWSDLLSNRQILRKLDQGHRSTGLFGKIKTFNAEDLHLEVGNPLLTSLGSYVKDFFQLLINREVMDGPGEPGFEVPAGESLLEKIQRDIFLLADPSQKSTPQNILDSHDHSLQIHSCHSPMREVEILYDQLLSLLDEDPDLKPSDIVVMTPDIDTYAPLIQSVFGGALEEKRRFYYSIADRSIRQESKVIRYFFRLLDMVKSRYTVTDVFDFLEAESLRDRFQLSDKEITMVREMVQEANVRWGINAAFRERMGTPATYETTWEFGIDRILTGYGLPAKEEFVFQGVLPFDDIEGGKAQTFGRFLEFFERLKSLVLPGTYNLKTPRTLPEWSALLRKMISLFFQEKEVWSREHDMLRIGLDELEKIPRSGLQVEIEVASSFLRERLDDLARKMGFLGYGVTFCSMKPMRAIPFRMIALLGMNDRAFPRINKKLSFDLMQTEHWLGDRSLKDEDRYLFLETILSCRKYLYISYVGQSIKDNSHLPPSTLVAELIHYIEQGYRVAPYSSIRKFLITTHPLQPFSAIYFEKGSGLFSYSMENMTAALQLRQRQDEKGGGFELNLSEFDPKFYEINIENLVRFFDNPSKFLFNQRLHVYLEDENELNKDEETFTLSGLDRYWLQSRLIESSLRQESVARQHEIACAGGALPLGEVGSLALERVLSELEGFNIKAMKFLEQEKLAPLEYDFILAGFHFQGVIQSAYQHNLIRFRPASVKVKDRLRLWLEQLIINYLQPAGYPRSAILLGLDEIFHCGEIEAPEQELRRILKHYRHGLLEPLAFFPRAAGIFMDHLHDISLEKKYTQTQKAWAGSEYYPGEMDQSPYFKRCFQGVDLFSETAFEEIVLDLLNPVYDGQKRK